MLEIGAGTGRVTAYLSRRGADITGLEPSARMLDRARARAEREHLTLKLVQGDVKTFRLEQRFELVIAPFNALMHLYTPNEQLQALENIHAHLAPGGQLVFDLSVPRYGATSHPAPRGRDVLSWAASAPTSFWCSGSTRSSSG